MSSYKHLHRNGQDSEVCKTLPEAIFIATVKAIWSNYRPMCRMWPATAFSVARGSIQEISANLKFVEKRVRLHLSH